MDNHDPSEVFGPMFAAIAKDGAIALRELGLPTDAAILDVGTGEGKFAAYLALQGYDVLTGEPSTDSSHYAGQDWASNAERVGVREKIRFEAFDASEMPFESAAFDAVFFFGVLHHVEEAARKAVVSEALRVSKGAGAVVFFEPRQELLEQIWANDPEHPLPAKPSDYLSGQQVREQQLEGTLMDIFVYRKAG